MLNGVVAQDLARDLIRDRLQLAARDALADQVTATAVGPSQAPRAWLANVLRSLAVRLDPTLGCEPCLAVLPSSR